MVFGTFASEASFTLKVNSGTSPKVVLLRQVTFLNRLYNIVTLVDDGVILTPVGFYQSVAGVVLKIIVHRSLICPVTGGTSFFRIFRTEIFDGKGGDTGGDVIITHHGVNVEDLSFGKCSGIIVFGKLSLWVTVQKIVASSEPIQLMQWVECIYLVSYSASLKC